ncbi:MAG TPA: prolyl oligopeptidase family serine peptidase, partial [Chthonomonadaceae bacterium]|nr:prolyl oligopeptidase family serine peptidase [Chthonomonadaceae bacterium]
AGWAIRCSGPGLAETVTRVPAIPPLTIRKVGFRIRAAAPPEAGSVDATLALSRGGDQPSDTAAIKLRVRNKAETRKITFVSAIDGSVQYYAVNPASTTGAAQHGPDRQSGHTGPNEPAGPGASGGKRGGAGLALFLTLHGAGVEAIGQADAYAPKSWGNIVAPTNRRPYGFDWEDWGRLDALEVLDLAKARFKPDPARIYLTGHSMGGHGTWHIGVTYPDKFAAIGPSAGWISLFSYAGATRAQNASEMQSLLLRPMQPSDTLSLERNTVPEGVYILHGDADDNVPVTEARQMKRELAAFHPDVQSWEQPGAGHWWSTDQHPAAGERFGAACVDWKPMFDLFASRRLPADPDVRAVEFYTADPGVSAWCHWAGILAQEHAFKVSAIQLSCDPAARTFSGTTDNVLRLELKTAAIAGPDPLIVRIDGQTISNIACPGACGPIWLEKRGGSWTAAGRPASSDKSPERCGPFKQAFRNRMVFVYGTKGTPDENAWAYARARFDAETFWYRGNGAVDVVADTAFHAGTDRDRSVVLYGNAETNGAWAALLRDSPVTVTRTAVGIGERKLDGADVACLFVRPRPGSATALVAAVSGTGLEGMRLTERLPYFSSGVEYPDFVAVRSSMLTDGASGVPAAGFFGPDWSVAKGEFAWQ